MKSMASRTEHEVTRSKAKHDRVTFGTCRLGLIFTDCSSWASAGVCVCCSVGTGCMLPDRPLLAFVLTFSLLTPTSRHVRLESTWLSLGPNWERAWCRCVEVRLYDHDHDALMMDDAAAARTALLLLLLPILVIIFEGGRGRGRGLVIVSMPSNQTCCEVCCRSFHPLSNPCCCCYCCYCRVCFRSYCCYCRVCFRSCQAAEIETTERSGSTTHQHWANHSQLGVISIALYCM